MNFFRSSFDEAYYLSYLQSLQISARIKIEFLFSTRNTNINILIINIYILIYLSHLINGYDRV